MPPVDRPIARRQSASCRAHPCSGLRASCQAGRVRGSLRPGGRAEHQRGQRPQASRRDCRPRPGLQRQDCQHQVDPRELHRVERRQPLAVPGELSAEVGSQPRVLPLLRGVVPGSGGRCWRPHSCCRGHQVLQDRRAFPGHPVLPRRLDRDRRASFPVHRASSHPPHRRPPRLPQTDHQSPANRAHNGAALAVAGEPTSAGIDRAGSWPFRQHFRNQRAIRPSR